MKGVRSIGGYFELEVSRGFGERYENALRYQSARAAFLALLRAGRPSRVWVPEYICDSMLEPLRQAKVQVCRYDIDDSLGVGSIKDFGADDWLLCVNYFGISTASVDEVLRRFPADKVVVDNAQAFFAEPRNCLATIYSPRKFFGVPDGGYLISTLDVPRPECRPEPRDIANRSRHLMVRLAGDVQGGHTPYREAERAFSMQEPCGMSSLSLRILEGIDYRTAGERRADNFARLHGALGARNGMRIAPDMAFGPLCYPYLSKSLVLRERLVAADVFAASYWPDILGSTNASSRARELAASLIPLPCDQRYGAEDMDRVIDIVRNTERAV